MHNATFEKNRGHTTLALRTRCSSAKLRDTQARKRREEKRREEKRREEKRREEYV
jgi:hypothetical protein